MSSFADNTAQRTGKHKRTVQRDATLDAAFPEAFLDSIAGTPGANRRSAPEKFAHLEPALQGTHAEMVQR